MDLKGFTRPPCFEVVTIILDDISSPFDQPSKHTPLGEDVLGLKAPHRKFGPFSLLQSSGFCLNHVHMTPTGGPALIRPGENQTRRGRDGGEEDYDLIPRNVWDHPTDPCILFFFETSMAV